MVLSKDITCIEAEAFIDVDENAIKFLESGVKPEMWSEDPFVFFNGNTSSYEAEDMMSDNFHWRDWMEIYKWNSDFEESIKYTMFKL